MSTTSDPWDEMAKQIQAERFIDLPWVRASSLPMFFSCASSMQPTEASVNEPSEAAEFGKAGHLAIAQTIKGSAPDIQQIAEDHQVDTDELREAHANAAKMWDEVRQYFPEPRTEFKLRSTITGGTTDLFFNDGMTMAFDDWKFGQTLRNHRDQILGYAHAAVFKYGFPSCGQIDAWIAYPRLNNLAHFAIKQDDLRWFEERYIEQASLIGKQHNPGETCSYCPRKYECEARQNWIRSSVCQLVSVGQETVSVEKLGSLYHQSRALMSAVKHYDKVLRQAIDEFGPIPVDETRSIHNISIKKEALNPDKTIEVLKRLGADHEKADALVKRSISKEEVEKLVKGAAPKGKKSKNWGLVMEELRVGGAVNTSSYKKLQMRKS